MLLRVQEKALLQLRGLYESFGYRQFQMSRFEEYGLYVANKDFLLSDQVITFTDPSGKLMALKPDVTLSIIKNAPAGPNQVRRLYYNENVYRPSGPMHSFKEILQAGVECVGDLSGYETAEVAYLAARSLGCIRSDFVLDISHMGLIASVLEESGLSAAGQKQALTCLHQKNPHELRSLCLAEGVAPEKLLALTGDSFDRRELERLGKLLTAPAQRQALEELTQVCATLETMGIPGRIQVDFSCAHDLKYYSGLVFKGYVPGIPASILSGGQYDRLLARMGKPSRAIGFAVYLDLLEDSAQPPAALSWRIDPTGAAPDQVLLAVEQYAREGTVLVSRDPSIPARHTVIFENGEAVVHG